MASSLIIGSEISPQVLHASQIASSKAAVVKPSPTEEKASTEKAGTEGFKENERKGTESKEPSKFERGRKNFNKFGSGIIAFQFLDDLFHK